MDYLFTCRAVALRTFLNQKEGNKTNEKKANKVKEKEIMHRMMGSFLYQKRFGRCCNIMQSLKLNA